ncbi:MAG: beta-propeller domain-containing protein, partial [Acidimicrobiales bacterium]|nr:beta-propeller domain-containing protein [Acidimicrobiales bacterium]
MNQDQNQNPDHDPVLADAGARLRDGVEPLSPAEVEAAVLKRRSRRLGAVSLVSLVAVAVLAATVIAQQGGDNDGGAGRNGEGVAGRASAAQVEEVLAGLGDAPVDPTKVRLVSTVTTFADCDALVADLRRVGAQHVGSRGFGAGVGGWPMYNFNPVGMAIEGAAGSDSLTPMARQDSKLAYTGPGDESTLGTNVQVAGVDELDSVKAVGDLIYDLDGRGNLRITDGRSFEVRSLLDVTPGADASDQETSESPRPPATVSQILVGDGTVAVFGEEYEVSEPIPGDPSATQASTPFMTVTMVDVSDPAAPKVTDRVRLEGTLVSARLVGGQVRLVTTSNLADLGFVVPTTPAAVPIALDQNRRTVAGSAVSDWIPDWQRSGDAPQPLVPCERVHVPDTFAGVAMTSMVTFSLAARFEPVATSILAPGATLYAGLDLVAISSEVWVDPAEREARRFKDWQTAIHEFRFAEAGDAPTYRGSGIIDGSTVGQFAFGEVGDTLGVVSSKGTPWSYNPESAVNLTLLGAPDREGGTLARAATLDDLADGRGAVSAVRFLDGRIVISTGIFGRETLVIDTTDPASPRRAGRVTVPGEVGYTHPLPDGKALMIGSRSDEVGTGNDRQQRTWVQAHLLDVSNADAPAVLATWERPWSADMVAGDHHAFTWWPERDLAMWGVVDTNWN